MQTLHNGNMALVMIKNGGLLRKKWPQNDVVAVTGNIATETTALRYSPQNTKKDTPYGKTYCVG